MANTVEQRILERMQVSKPAQMEGLVARANANPRSLSQDELMLANQYANELGLDLSKAKAKDVATTAEKWMAGIGGGIDSLAFGLVPDKWYSSYRTKDAEQLGKLVGNVAGMMIPGLGMIKAGKTVASLVKGAKAINDGGIAIRTVKALSKLPAKDLIALANQLVRIPKAGIAGYYTSSLPMLGNNPQESPFNQLPQTGTGGMPEMR